MTRSIARKAAESCPIDGFALEFDMDRRGHVRERCQGCDRRRARRCMDCGAPVKGRAWRCPKHLRARAAAHVRASLERYRDDVNARRRRQRRNDPDLRERQNASCRKWRRTHPKAVMLQHRRARLGGKGGYATREKYLAKHVEYRKRNPEKMRAYRRNWRLRNPRKSRKKAA